MFTGRKKAHYLDVMSVKGIHMNPPEQFLLTAEKIMDGLSDQEFDAIVKVRAARKQQIALGEHQNYVDTLKDIGYVLLQGMPHDRTSCNERASDNAWFTGDYQMPRCTRCSLETVINGDQDLPLGFRLQYRWVR